VDEEQWEGSECNVSATLERMRRVPLISTSYINFAHGDEPLEEIYGDNLPRLRKLKHKWDLENRFNQWFNIQ
jgi:hypothetical protein